MPNLETAIENWRAQLSAGESVSRDNLTELELHLRDSIAELQSKGLSETEAFTIASRRLGPAAAIHDEFGKVNQQFVTRSRLLWVLFGVLGGAACVQISTACGWSIGGVAAAAGASPLLATSAALIVIAAVWATALFLLGRQLRAKETSASRTSSLWWIAGTIILIPTGEILRRLAGVLYARSLGLEETGQAIV